MWRGLQGGGLRPPHTPRHPSPAAHTRGVSWASHQSGEGSRRVGVLMGEVRGAVSQTAQKSDKRPSAGLGCRWASLGSLGSQLAYPGHRGYPRGSGPSVSAAPEAGPGTRALFRVVRRCTHRLHVSVRRVPGRCLGLLAAQCRSNRGRRRDSSAGAGPGCALEEDRLSDAS